MATRGKKISEQTLAASLDGNEIIPFAKNGADGAVKASKIKEYVQPDLSKLDSLPTATELDATITGVSARVTTLETDGGKLAFIERWKNMSSAYCGSLALGYDKTDDQFTLAWSYSLDIAKKYQPKMTYKQAMLAIDTVMGPVLGYANVPDGIVYNLPPIGYNVGSGPYLYIAKEDVVQYNGTLKVLILSSVGSLQILNKRIKLTSCSALKAIIGIIRAHETLSGNPIEFVKGHYGFPALEFFRAIIKQSLNVATSPLLTLDTMQYLVNYAQNTSPITVTVHPDVYAKLTGDTTNAAASALTADELAQWQALVTTANSKNISFATPE